MLATVGTLLLMGASACSSGGSASSLGPFRMTGCQMGWSDPRLDFFTTRSAAQAAINQVWGTNGGVEQVVPTQASTFSLTTTGTVVLGSFTVAYYNKAGTEIATGTAIRTDNGPSQLTAGQHATFVDAGTFQSSRTSDAASCQVIGSDSGNAGL
jgi:hypothetical protein